MRYTPIPDYKKYQEPILNADLVCDKRPPVIDVMYKDVLKTYQEGDLKDIFAYCSEDYLDDTREVTEDEWQAYKVRVAHALLEK